MISEKNLLVHELIGLGARVLNASSLGMIGLRGTVVDETKNTFVLESRGREVRIPKQSCVFAFRLPSGRDAVVKGSEIAFSPIERLKKLARKIR